MKHTLVFAVIVLIVLAGYYLFVNQASKSELPINPEPQEEMDDVIIEEEI